MLTPGLILLATGELLSGEESLVTRENQVSPNYSSVKPVNFQAPSLHIESQSTFQPLTIKYELTIKDSKKVSNIKDKEEKRN